MAQIKPVIAGNMDLRHTPEGVVAVKYQSFSLERIERNRILMRIRTARSVVKGGMVTFEYPSQENLLNKSTKNVQSTMLLQGKPRAQLQHWRNLCIDNRM
jgi:hypothetical protein